MSNTFFFVISSLLLAKQSMTFIIYLFLGHCCWIVIVVIGARVGSLKIQGGVKKYNFTLNNQVHFYGIHTIFEFNNILYCNLAILILFIYFCSFTVLFSFSCFRVKLLLTGQHWTNSLYLRRKFQVVLFFFFFFFFEKSK